MILAIDIETAPNAEAIPFLPEPKISKVLKDPAKIAAAKEEARADQIANMALDALTGRVICFAAVGEANGEEVAISQVAENMTDAKETELIQQIFGLLGQDETRLVTWNGMGFDLPFIYKRALILDVCPANFGAPPLTAWTKRYSADRHFDLMKIWSNWASGSDGFVKLDTVARMILKESKTEDVDVTTFAQMMQTPAGREYIGKYCLQDTRLTWRLFAKINGWLFA